MFKQTLKSIVEKTDGSLGALIMGADGLPVESFFTEAGADANLDVVTASFTQLIRSAGKTGKDLDLGDLRELVIAMDKVTIVMRLFNQDYFAVLAMNPEGNLGRGRYELRKAELTLAKEFAV